MYANIVNKNMYNIYICINTINYKRQYLCLKLFLARKWKSLLPKLAIQGSPLITPFSTNIPTAPTAPILSKHSFLG